MAATIRILFINAYLLIFATHTKAIKLENSTKNSQ